MNTVVKTKRRGARAARQAERRSPIPRTERPIQPGMSGGAYRPLSEAEIQRVHLAALDVLENIGLADAIPSCRSLIVAAGGRVDEQTMALMRKEYVYPEIADRSSPKEWAEQGSTDMLQRAHKRVKDILSTHYPSHISADLDAEIRGKFSVGLPRENMLPGSNRW